MKRYLLLLLAQILLMNASGQNLLGQTQKYIISKNDFCRISSIDSTLLIFECNDLTQAYFFSGNLKLCSFICYELPKSKLNDYKSQLLDQGYTFFAKVDSYPIVLTLKSGNNNLSSPASIYENKKFTISVLEYDLWGDDNSEKFGVYVEYYKKEMFDK